MSILSFLRLLFQLVVSAYLRVWHNVLRTFRRIHRSRRPRKQANLDLPHHYPLTQVTSNPIPSIRAPIPAVVSRPRSDVCDITPTAAPTSRLNMLEPHTTSLLHQTKEPKETWSLTSIFFNLVPFSSTPQSPDVESARLDVYRLTPPPPSHTRSLATIRPPFQEPLTFPKPSLFSKATRFLAQSEPFSNACPSCLDGQITDRSQLAVECGGFSDVYEGMLRGRLVAIKVFRSFTNSSRKKPSRSKLQKRVWREYLTWSSLSHQNILPCLGFTFDFAYDVPSRLPALVSPWQPNGTVLEYLHNYPSAKRLPLLVGITNGVYYLHSRSKPVVHGDIRCSNILVSSNGEPCLADFGLSRILNDALGLTTSSDVGGSLRWMSPEILDGNKITTESDAWAYGMTILELLTQKRPYAHLFSEPAVLRHIIDHTLPPRPSLECAPDLADQIWLLCQNCWKIAPKERTTMANALLTLQP